MTSDTQTAAYNGARAESSYWRWVVFASQIGIYPVVLVMRLVLVRRNLRRERHDDSLADWRGSNVVYANHQSQLDPFLLCAALPPKTLFRLLPFRFFIANAYFANPVMAFVLKVFGGFPARFHPSKPYGLDHANQLLGSNQTVVIFPQGMRTRTRVVKPGISALAAEPNVRLIPVHLNWRNRLTCEVRLGQAFGGLEAVAPEQLMDAVYALTRASRQ